VPRHRACITHTWGSTAAERELEFPCDRYLPEADEAVYRAVTVYGPPDILFRWLCQLRAAPYSYDWIDNLGRRSPRELTPGLENLEPGQQVMTIFELAEFEPDRQLTLELRRMTGFFGEIAGTYLIVPLYEDRCRLVVKLSVRWPRVPVWGRAIRAWLPAGDMVMMRRQLLNLKSLAEATRTGVVTS
jgi:hypothetical protein